MSQVIPASPLGRGQRLEVEFNDRARMTQSITPMQGSLSKVLDTEA